MNFPFSEHIVLENERVRLEPFLNIDDRTKMQDVAFADNTLLRHSPTQIHTSELLEVYFNNALALWKLRSRYTFLIFDKQQEKYAGSTSYLNISEAHGRLEIGSTWMGKEFQRTGLNRNCKLLMLNYAFEQLNCQRVELKTDGRNTQSQTAIKAIGAEYEGTLRSHTVMYDGYRRDTVCFSILKNEWPTFSI